MGKVKEVPLMLNGKEIGTAVVNEDCINDVGNGIISHNYNSPKFDEILKEKRVVAISISYTGITEKAGDGLVKIKDSSATGVSVLTKNDG